MDRQSDAASAETVAVVQSQALPPESPVSRTSSSSVADEGRFVPGALLSAVFFINSFGALTLGLDWKAWYAPYGLATLLLLVTIAVVAFWHSLDKRGLLGDEATEST